MQFIVIQKSKNSECPVPLGKWTSTKIEMVETYLMRYLSQIGLKMLYTSMSSIISE